jgi:hypothetical protein
MKSAAAVLGFCALLVMTSFIIVPTQAWAKPFINKNWKGVAIKGYDPVAYFTLSKPVEGKKDHLRLFKSDPEKYAPQYGGY